MVHSTRLDRRFRRAGVIRALALAILAVPVVLLLVLGLAEVLGGVWSGVQHVVQAAPLVVLAGLAWRRPRMGGWALIASALLLSVLFALVLNAPTTMRLATAAIFFGPPLLAGVLFVLVARRDTRVLPPS